MVHQVDAIIGIVEALSLGWAGLDLKFIWVIDSIHKWDPPPPCWKKVMERIVKIEKTNTMTNTWNETRTKADKDKDRKVGK